jgi:iron transport multicopper oxidase
MLKFALASFVLAATSYARVVPVTLNIVNTRLAPDGFTRSVITANGTYPGPLIKANKGDELRVTVNNRLTDPTMRRSTSLNFDGIYLNSSNNWEDATPFVNACPLGPGASYTYDIPLINGQTGTHWYHSQLSVQYVDGLRGPLVIYDPDDPLKNLYDIDDESTIIQIGDWWHNSSVELLANYTSGPQGRGIVPVPDCGTFNGRGRFKGGPAVPFGTVTVTPGKRHRLRVINQAARDVFTFSIDNHTLTVIEADGVEHEPIQVQQIDIHAGQRYSLILNANQPVANYWVRAPLAGGSLTNNPNQDPNLSRGIIRYRGAPNADPVSVQQTNPIIFNEADLVPIVPSDIGDVPADVNLTFVLEPFLGVAVWNVNGVSYLAPERPTLLKVLADNATTQANFNVSENTFVLPRNKIVQITFPPNDDDDAHPIHLHGHNFEVVKSSSSNVTNTKNPPRRDVTAAAAAGMSLRFRTDTPGPWFFHCHIFWHMAAGLATVMLPDPVATRQLVHPPAEWQALCPNYAKLPPELQ